ncbi:methyl-accepting chemotaxis protein [Desulfitobacterium dehalogenans ATCC 51507]|uniref:Methyl-accepting chemotaxis protein n=1 Tax=Desulfitobacterium dehalogenans (strain ATCC 51507 / DSM 9161 / JW/IU-DC1) TaxID=756499 RepID=I4AE63_DESDJ|nr:methyl-accepting chemotaxis protein [Desulfitobacterium dehalogenans]AFM02248.1 methyl-accepting chemotaxis protein [Desulfitobacterium dehalogenans ATCC 51507]
MKLKARLFSMLLATSLIPLLIFSAVSIPSFISSSQQSSYQLSQDKIAIAKAEINGMLDKNFNTLHMVANQPAIRNFDLPNAKNILLDAVKVNPELIIALDDTEGQQVVKSNDDALTKINERDFFKQAMNGTEEYVSDILVAKATGELIVVISTPVRDMNNNIVGVLQANIQLAQLSDFVTELSEGGSSIYVISRQGTVLAHPLIEYVQNQEDFSSLEFVQTGFTGQDMTIQTTNIQGEEVIASHTLNELTGWLIAVETPVSVAMASANRLLYTSIGLLLAVSIVVGLLGLIFSKRFTEPLVQLSSVIETIASGDLTDFEIKIKSKDEIGQLYDSLKTMTQNLRGLVVNIQEVASTLASHSLQLSSTTEETTQSLTQVVTTINEMAQGNSNQALMIQGSTDAINTVNNIVSEATQKTDVGTVKAKESLELAKAGQEALERQSQKIEENNKYSNAVGQSILQLATMADEIRNMISAINSIAEQTNLLALNASIEAARAGDAGRGFAVVAEEIRKLAEQSGSSTKKIEDIVNGINGKVTEAVNNMNQAKESVVVMESSAEDTKESFAKIFASITELAQNSYEISIALEEINNQTKEVADQATNISAVVEQASAGMQEISASSEEQLASIETIAHSSGQLENVAHELLTQVAKLKIE